MRDAGVVWWSPLANAFRSLKPHGSSPERVFFIRIKPQEDATDGPGQRHHGAFDGGSQCASGGHR